MDGPIMVAWPKLSTALACFDQDSPAVCQRCFAAEGGDVMLHRWREHDDADQPTDVVIVLCGKCEHIIEPHPRLYSRLHVFEPHPGTMRICVDCVYRAGLRCGHPDLTANGGTGLKLTFPKPGVMFVDGKTKGGKNFGFSMVNYIEPARCESRKVAGNG